MLSIHFQFPPMEDESVPKQNNVNNFKWLWDPSVTHIVKSHYWHTEQQQQNWWENRKHTVKAWQDCEAFNLETPSFALVCCNLVLVFLRPAKALKCEIFTLTVRNSTGFWTGYLWIWTSLLQIGRMNLSKPS